MMEVEQEVKKSQGMITTPPPRMILVLNKDQKVITITVVKITNHSAKVDSNQESSITKETLTKVIGNTGEMTMIKTSRSF